VAISPSSNLPSLATFLQQELATAKQVSLDTVEVPREGALRRAWLGWTLQIFGTILVIPILVGFRGGIVGALLLSGAWGLVNFGKRLRVLSATSVMKGDKRPPVLYLRSFDDDNRTSHLRRRMEHLRRPISDEELLVHSIRTLGPVVAIGRPGERIATLGAARMYVKDADWQQTVRSLMLQSQAIVFRASVSSGLLWELAEACAVGLDKTIIWLAIPQDPKLLLGRTSHRQMAYDRFRLTVRKLLPTLPVRIEDAIVIYFDRYGVPHTVSPRPVRFFDGFNRLNTPRIQNARLAPALEAIWRDSNYARPLLVRAAIPRDQLTDVARQKLLSKSRRLGMTAVFGLLIPIIGVVLAIWGLCCALGARGGATRKSQLANAIAVNAVSLIMSLARAITKQSLI
jgi:hypothetical protein